MPVVGSQRQANPTSVPHRPKTHIYSAEATGLLIIGLMILALTLIRYWHYINWSAR